LTKKKYYNHTKGAEEVNNIIYVLFLQTHTPDTKKEKILFNPKENGTKKSKGM